MKLLFTSGQGEIAGSSYSLIYLIKGLVSKGHELHLACKYDSLLWQSLSNQKNVTCHPADFRSYLDLKAAIRLKEIILKNDIDLICPQGGKDRNLSLLVKILWQRSLKVVFIRRQRPRQEPLIKRLFHLQFSDSIVMVSHGLKEIFMDMGYPQDHLRVIHNGIPDLRNHLSSKLQRELIQKHRLENKTVIGCLARKKSQSQLIRALRFLPEDFVLLMVGVEQKDFVKVVEEVKPKQQIIYTGIVDHHIALNYLSLMRVNILPSYLDGFGLVLLESIQLGIPVIGSAFGGIPDVIRHHENGALFQNEDIKGLAKEIKRFCEDEQLRMKVIRNGYETALNSFSIEHTIRKYESLFSLLVPENLQ